MAEDEFHQPADDEESQGLGAQCEEVSLTDYIFTNHLLDTRSIEENKVALHMNDVSCTWMGVPSEQESGHPKLFIWPRFQRLLDMNHDPPPRQYPSLVSVVGDTGSGKSTLIRSMIQMLSPKDPKKHEVPIPGSNNDQFDSTSSDVHVYADPYTVATEYPRFFVGKSILTQPARHVLTERQTVKGSPALPIPSQDTSYGWKETSLTTAPLHQNHQQLAVGCALQ